MQYLLKISIENTQAWRLIAVDGEADCAHVAHLITLAFDYQEGTESLIVSKQKLECGVAGEPQGLKALETFDSLKLDMDDDFEFAISSNPNLKHIVHVMKKEEHLFCLMPSCLVGSGLMPKNHDLTADEINAFYDSEEIQSLDLREVTNRLRAYGSKRKNLDGNKVSEAVVRSGAAPLNFELK